MHILSSGIVLIFSSFRKMSARKKLQGHQDKSLGLGSSAKSWVPKMCFTITLNEVRLG